MRRPKNPARADPINFTEHGPGELPALRAELNRSRARGGFPVLHDDKPMFIKSGGYSYEVFHTPEEAEQYAMKNYGRRAQIIRVRRGP